MGFFSRRSEPKRGGTSLQPPDEQAALGSAALESGDTMSALESYYNAVDKLHTMYVIGGCQYRRPSLDDAEILAGLLTSAEQTAGDPAAAGLVHRSCLYLEQVAQAASTHGANPSMYLGYLEKLQQV